MTAVLMAGKQLAEHGLVPKRGLLTAHARVNHWWNGVGVSGGGSRGILPAQGKRFTTGCGHEPHCTPHEGQEKHTWGKTRESNSKPARSDHQTLWWSKKRVSPSGATAPEVNVCRESNISPSIHQWGQEGVFGAVSRENRGCEQVFGGVEALSGQEEAWEWFAGFLRWSFALCASRFALLLA